MIDGTSYLRQRQGVSKYVVTSAMLQYERCDPPALVELGLDFGACT